ncbi:glutamine synthetase [Sinorhizobium meliloti]|uniref:glutamine synthetase family protein n=1 Tax=Rhizobium meliloti TaxID=382 RepID=UPI0012963E24|nr:glutamine synthetase family protein [Sinorhizobium meliloti]MDW9592399.1 glutamine synthetase [Sinorhizobium meliloti]MDX0187141.1 glutamine synthetase [Sinorhizobium meliloti]MQV10489.1 glutamine synthetase [Sinorhizobium meliloti]MQV61619.1 glutamine synthetase [Sinorhizobium meliloti]
MSIDADDPEVFQSWLEQNGPIESIQAVICDLNGIMRGKRVPVEQARKVLGGGIRMPLSIVGVDVWGEDIIGSAQVFATGDRDGICGVTGRGALPVNWTSRPSALVPLWLFVENGRPFLADPRQALAAIMREYRELGLRPVVATELEFYLIDPEPDSAVPPISPYTGKRLDSDAILSIDELDDFGEFFFDVYRECARQNVPADAAIAENGIGQFEINLLHSDDPLKAADDAIFFKRIVKGVARKHGLAATFMAKPYGTRSGNGMHVHFSLLDEEGNNVFDDGSDEGSAVLKHAVAGLLRGMAETTLMFAPHFNSYRRLRPDTHAPTSISWGYENRTSAIRIPGGNPAARRIEHRVAGADANPYLVIAAILGAALVGIRNKWKPPAPVEGRAYAAEKLPKIPADWGQAVDAFEAGPIAAEIFDPVLRSMLIACKRQEIAGFAEQVTDYEFSAYLEIV